MRKRAPLCERDISVTALPPKCQVGASTWSGKSKYNTTQSRAFHQTQSLITPARQHLVSFGRQSNGHTTSLVSLQKISVLSTDHHSGYLDKDPDGPAGAPAGRGPVFVCGTSLKGAEAVKGC